MAIFTLTPGTDTFTGNAGESNFFDFTPATLQSGDAVTGGATGGFIDTLRITATGTIASGQFAGVTNVEQLDLSSGGNDVTLTNGLVAGTSIGYFAVVDGGGNDTVDASGITNNIAIAFLAGTGTDTFKGGSGSDAFIIAAADLTSADTIQGGAAFDNFYLSTAGTVAATAFNGVSGIEGLVLNSGGNTVTLTNSLDTGASVGYLTVAGGAGNDTVDASGVSNAIPIVFFANGGTDTFLGANGNDTVVIATADLTTATLQGGTGFDNLYLSTAGTVTVAAANVTGFEGLVLASGTNIITLTNGSVASSNNGAFAVADNTGDDTVDASGVTNPTTIVFYASSGSETFKGGSGNDAFVFAAAELTSADIVQGGAGFDNLYLTTAGTVAATAFDNVSGIEGLVLNSGGNSVTLTNSLDTGASVGYLTVAGGVGNDTVDASGVTNSIPIAFFGTTGGNDAFTGGNGNDSFLFAAGTLSSLDLVAGGTGSDTLWMTTSGTVTTGNIANVSGIEQVFQQAGGTFNFINGLTGAASLAAVGSSAVDTFNGATVTGYALSMNGNGGADVLTGGSQNDVFNIPDSAFASINGNGGIDRIVLTTPAQSFSLTANNAKITNTEIVSLSGSAGASLTLAGTDIPLVNSGGNALYVVGESDDTVSIGTGWTVIAANVVNNAVEPGHTFTEYQHTTGALLFIDNPIPQAPFITSNGGGDTASISVDENTTAVTTVAATDPNPSTTLIFSKNGGVDEAKFSIDSGTGALAFIAAPNFEIPTDTAAGGTNTYTVVVRASDGVRTDDQTITVNVQNVNEAPLNTVPGGQTVNEDTALAFNSGNSNLISISDVDAGANPVRVTLTVQHGALTLSGTAGLSFAGPGFGDGTADASMSFTGTVSAINTALNGLSYTGALNYNSSQGAETLSIVTNDQGNTGSGSAQQDSDTVDISVTPVNDAPTASNFTFSSTSSAIRNTDLVVDDNSDSAPDPAGPQKTVSGDLLGGANDVDGPGPLQIVVEPITTTDGGKVVIEADGDFTYTPKVGTTAITDSFTYHVTDQNPGTPGIGTGTVTIALQTNPSHIWYVDDSAAPGGDGSSEKPFNSLAPLTTGGAADGLDGANDIIFLYNGTYSGDLVLETGQQLISQSRGLVVSNGGAGTVTLEAATGSNATINGIVTLASGNTIDGIDFGTTSGFALRDGGTTVGTATVSNSSINNTTGGAVNIANGGTLAMDFTSVSSTGGTNGIALGNTTGTFHAHGGTLSNATSADVSITGNNAGDDVAFTYDGAINDDLGQLVAISGQSGGTKDFNGAITDGNDGDGSGISLSGNTGATIRFDGGLTLSTGVNAAFTATGGGTVAVIDPGGVGAGVDNTIVTTTGTALNISNTTIHSEGVTFRSISANGAANGIVLNTTGSNGLTVTGLDGIDAGTNPDAGTGGTIQATTGDGVSLTGANNVSLGGMNITNTGGHGINMSGGSNLTLTTESVTGAGDGDNEHGLRLFNATGTVSIQGSTFSDATEDLINVASNNNSSLTLNIGTVTGNTFTHGATLGDLNAFTGNGILINGSGSSNYTLNVANSAFNNIKLAAIQVGGDGTWTGNNTNVTLNQNNFLVTIAGGNSLGNPNNRADYINIQGRNTVDIDASITSNTLTGGGGGGIQLGADESSNVSANITGNAISNQFADGILIGVDESATLTVLIDNNIITNTSSDGMEISNAISPDGLAATLNATITNNTVTGHNSNAGNNAFFGGIAVFGGADAPDNTNVDIRNNHVSGNPSPGTYFDYALDGSDFGDAIAVKGPGTAAVTAADLLGFMGNTSAAAPAGQTFIGNAFFNNNANVPTPVLTPLLAAAGGVDSAFGTPGETHLTQGQLDAVVASAINHWAATGISAAQLAILHNVSFGVADMSGIDVGESTPGHITLDSDAAGYGWFIDPTPGDDVEFGHALAATRLQTDPTEAPAGHIDLLTVAMHELGHQLGLEDTYDAADRNELMFGELVTGERRLPAADDVAHASETSLQAAPDFSPTSDVVVDAGDATLHAGQGGKILVGGAGADTFVFDQVLPQIPASVTHIADYSALQGDTIDVSALLTATQGMKLTDAMQVRASEDASGSFSSLQVNAGAGWNSGDQWVAIAQLDGVHAGDAINVIIDPSHGLHQIHADWLA
jgi:hypothetical protein